MYRQRSLAPSLATFAAAAAGLAACSVGDVDLSGRRCPCAPGYVCDEAIDTCVRSVPPTDGPGDAPARDAPVPDARTPDAPPPDAGADLAGDAALDAAPDADSGLIFADEFDGDLSAWIVYGDCPWSVQDGELLQLDSSCPLPLAPPIFVYAPATQGLTDFRAVTRMRKIAGADPHGAMELAFRIFAGSGPALQLFFCNWEPNSGTILLMVDPAGPVSGVDLVTMDPDGGVTIPSSYTPETPVIMELEARGTNLACRVKLDSGEVLGEIAYTDTTYGYASGAIGLKTWRMATAFDYIRVFAITP